MRRLWAHIVLAFAALVMVSTTFVKVFSSSTSNLDYENGQEIIYRLTNKKDRSLDVEEGANKDIAEEMAKRLDKIDITAYRISVSGDDIIKVDFADSGNVSRSNIINYLGFNGSLGLSNMDDNDQYYQITGSEFLLEDNKTYLDEINSYPTVVIPVDTDNANFKLLIENTEKQHENGIGEKQESEESSSESEDEPEVTTYLYLWYDFDEEVDRYSRTVEGNEDYDEKIAAKIIMKFNIEDLWYPDEKENKLFAAINLDTNGDESISYSEIKTGYDNARFYVNLLNCSELDYDVKYINDNYTVTANAWTEVLVKKGDFHISLNWSNTLIASLISIVVITLLLIVFYKLMALAIGACTLLSVFSAVGFLITLGAEFNVAAFIGIMLVGVASLACGIIYASRLKDESYKGRSLKKANTEAGKKSLLPTCDIALAVILTGAFTYLLGGALMRSFAIVTVIGGLVSLLINLLGLRGLTWLSTNTTGLIGRYDVFGIEKENVPSITEEEKQTYFSSFDGKDFTKHKKPIGIAFGALFLVGLVGLILSANLFKGEYFTDKTTTQATEVYFYTEDDDSLIIKNSTYVEENIIAHTFLQYEGKDDVALVELLNNVYTFSHEDRESGIDYTTNYVVASFAKYINPETKAYFIENPNEVISIKDLFANKIATEDPNSSTSFKTSTLGHKSSNNACGIMLGTVIAALVMGLYFILRYRLSRGVIATIAPFLATGITAGIFALASAIGATLPNNIVLMIPLIAVFTNIVTVMWMSKEKDILNDEKDKQTLNDITRREEIVKKTNSIAFSSISVFGIIAIFLTVCFFGFGPSATSLIFICALIGVLLAIGFVAVLFGVWSHFLYGKLHKSFANKPKKIKKKGNLKPTHTSGEPEEAIFIGIND